MNLILMWFQEASRFIKRTLIYTIIYGFENGYELYEIYSIHVKQTPFSSFLYGELVQNKNFC